MVAAFVGSRAARTLAQGCCWSFLAATCSMVMVRQELLEGENRGAGSPNSIWIVTLFADPYRQGVSGFGQQNKAPEYLEVSSGMDLTNELLLRIPDGSQACESAGCAKGSW